MKIFAGLLPSALMSIPIFLAVELRAQSGPAVTNLPVGSLEKVFDHALSIADSFWMDVWQNDLEGGYYQFHVFVQDGQPTSKQPLEEVLQTQIQIALSKIATNTNAVIDRSFKADGYLCKVRPIWSTGTPWQRPTSITRDFRAGSLDENPRTPRGNSTGPSRSIGRISLNSHHENEAD
ncbi:MAG: hypothetical protein KIS67_10265 [Verrucomicrobiae bacterium]|nr:hypothetical protein [Verrucomicrobiae bacterium]